MNMNAFVELPNRSFFTVTKHILESCSNYPELFDLKHLDELEKLRYQLM